MENRLKEIEEKVSSEAILTNDELEYLENISKEVIEEKVSSKAILTNDELEYLENIFKEEIKKRKPTTSLIRTISTYYTNNDNLDKIICLSNYAFENNYEEYSEIIFGVYLYEHSTEEDIKKYEELDYPFVHFKLGDFYENDLNKSLEHYAKGAEQGSIECASKLVNYYIYGKPSYIVSTPLEEIDYEKIIYYANLGLEKIQDILLNKQYEANVKIDAYHLFYQLEKSENLNKEEKDKYDSMIMNSRSLLFQKSIYYFYKYLKEKDKNNLSMYLYYCTLAADKGYYDANKNLFSFFAEDPLQKDYKKALYYYQRAYEINKTDNDKTQTSCLLSQMIRENNFDIFDNCSQDILIYFGNLYEEYDEENTNFPKLFYEKAIEKGIEKVNSESLYILGCAYMEGKYLKQDYEKAFEYINKAVMNKIPDTKNYLGYMYYYGLGVKQDREKAMECYKKNLNKGTFSNKTQFKLNKEAINELFEKGKRTKKYEKDEFFKNLHEHIKKGAEVVTIENIKNLTLEQLNNISDDTIIHIIGNLTDLDSAVQSNFYTCSDMKKILKVCNKILSEIDLNKNEEDIFMQIYIKLGKMISYDHDAVKKHEGEKISTSRNLMVLLSKKGVCVGYAVVLNFLLRMAGIESKYLVSERDINNDSHAYNQVKINGKWYYCDLTWDSNKIRLGTVKYCLRSKKSFKNEDKIFHATYYFCKEHKANGDYPNVKKLFIKNLFKLLKINLKLPIEQLIEYSEAKELGGIVK